MKKKHAAGGQAKAVKKKPTPKKPAPKAAAKDKRKGKPRQKSERPPVIDIRSAPIPFHPLADAFPLIEGAEFDALVADVRAHGVREPVILYKGMILDGRNRYRAARAADQPVRFQPFTGDDPIAFVVSANLRRRHLDESQRAMVAAELVTFTHGGDRRSDDTAAAGIVTQEAAARLVNVSERTVRSAIAVRDHGTQELRDAAKRGEIKVSVAADVAKLSAAKQRKIVETAREDRDEARELIAQEVKNARVVAPSRREPDDSLDFFPTPPWATRALVERVFTHLGIDAIASVWEPACGEGHIVEVLRERCAIVHASDIHDYNWRDDTDYYQADFLKAGPRDAPIVDWIITNPPFSGDRPTEFVLRALDLAGTGVAMFFRSQWPVEGIDRYDRIFRDRPPTLCAWFVERCPVHKGRWDPDGDTLTAYCWLVWLKGQAPQAPFWIPPGCREQLSKPDDRQRFTAHPVIPWTADASGAQGKRSWNFKPGKTADPVLAEWAATHGHLVTMTSDHASGDSAGTCACGKLEIKFPRKKHHEIELAIAAHWRDARTAALAAQVPGDAEADVRPRFLQAAAAGTDFPEMPEALRRTANGAAAAAPAAAEPAPPKEGYDKDAVLLAALEAVEAGNTVTCDQWLSGELGPLMVGKKKPRLTKAGQLRLEQLREQAAHAAALAALPADIDELIADYVATLERYHAAVLAADRGAAEREAERLDLLQVKANGGTNFGMDCDDSPAEQLRKHAAAPIGDVPMWGQRGMFRIEIDGTPYLIEYGGDADFGAFAEDPAKPFVSETGFRSFIGRYDGEARGFTVAQQAEAYIREEIANPTDYKTGRGKPRKKPLPLPECWYRLPANRDDGDGGPVWVGGEHAWEGERRKEAERDAKLLPVLEAIAADAGAVIPTDLVPAIAGLLAGKGKKLRLTKKGEKRLAELREARAHQDALAALPDDVEQLIALYAEAIDAFDRAVRTGDGYDDPAVQQAADRLELLQEKANGGTIQGMALGDSPAERLRESVRMPVGCEPEHVRWGVPAMFRMEVDGTPYLVRTCCGIDLVDFAFDVFAVERTAPFFDRDGSLSFDCFDSHKAYGKSVVAYVTDLIRDEARSRKKKMPLPDTVFRLPSDWSECDEPIEVDSEAGAAGVPAFVRASFAGEAVPAEAAE